MTRKLIGVIATVLLVLTTLSAQAPTCRMCPAAYIGHDEIDAYTTRARANTIVDQQVRAVDIGKSHVAVGLVHRTTLTTPGEVAEHDLVM